MKELKSKCKTCLGCEYQATPEYKEKMRCEGYAEGGTDEREKENKN